jgi:hypothetical protein
MSVFFPHGWHARAHPLPSFPPYFLQPSPAIIFSSLGMLGRQFDLVLFNPNLAVDAHGVVLALDQRDWNAFIGLAQRAGCLSGELEATGQLMRDFWDEPEDEESNSSYRSWVIDTGVSCPISQSIVAPYAIDPTVTDSMHLKALRNRLYTSFSITGFSSSQRNLEGGGQLPIFLHDLFVVLEESYSKRLDAPTPAIDPWIHICRALVPVHDTNTVMQEWCSSYFITGCAPW